VREAGAERDLDAALVALIEAALRRAGSAGEVPPAEQARLVARALAVGLRELVRAPLREALQAGYDLGWRAAEDAQRQGAANPPRLPPDSRPADDDATIELDGLGSALQRTGPEPLSASTAEPAALELTTHQVSVEVGPLPNFSAVNRFHAAVAGAPGVADTTMVAFRDGRLTLRVEHPDGEALAASLRALDLGPLRVLAATPSRVELALDSRQSSILGRQQARGGRLKPTTPSQ
jgi:hypothetical protein